MSIANCNRHEHSIMSLSRLQLSSRVIDCSCLLEIAIDMRHSIMNFFPLYLSSCAFHFLIIHFFISPEGDLPSVTIVSNLQRMVTIFSNLQRMVTDGRSHSGEIRMWRQPMTFLRTKSSVQLYEVHLKMGDRYAVRECIPACTCILLLSRLS